MGKSFKFLSASIASVMCALSLGCVVGKTSVSAATSGEGTNPSAVPVISQIAPQSLPAGAPTQAIKVLGTNFSDQAVILWNGARLKTSAVDSGTLSGMVDSTVLASASVAQLQVVNSAGQQSSAVSFTVTAAPPVTTAALKIATSSASAASFGVAYSQPLQASGGTPNYSWAITSGSLPAGLSLVPSAGMIAGTPTVSGTFPVVVAVTDSSSPAQTQSTSLAITVTPSSLSVSSSTMSAGSVGVAYSQPLQATGGTPGYNWAVTAGSLPTGLSLAPSAGMIAGTPSAAGTFPFTVTVADSSSPAQSKSISASISVSASALSVATTSLAAGVTGTSYSQTLQATGGTPAYVWSVTSGTLPAGLSITPSGVIAGTPTVAGTFPVTATVTDNGSPAQSKSATFSVVVSPSSQLAITSSTLAAATSGTPYSQSLQAGGGTAPYAWSVISGTIPAGLTLASTGIISGTPVAAGAFPFTVTVTDSSKPAQSKSVSTSLTVNAPVLAITYSYLSNGAVGTTYFQTLQASGGTPSYKWTVTSGSLPAGMSLSSAGVVSGTPTASGTFSITATVTDSGSPAQTKSVLTSVTIAPTALTVTSSTLAPATASTVYSQALQASGGTPSYSWSVTAGALPAGITLAPSGVLAGSPTVSGTFSFTAKVADNGSPAQTQSVSVSLTVSPTTLTVTSSSVAAGTNGTAYTQTLQATGGTTPYTWSVASGSLPAGLSLAPSTGVISGTPTAAGTSTFTAAVTDASSPVQTKSVSLSLTIAASTLSISSSTLAGGTSGAAYSQTLAASGGTTPYVWSVASGTLPAGLTLNPSTGVVSGTPTAAGNATFTVSVTDGGSPAQTKSVSTSIAIAASTLSISSSSLAGGTSGAAYSQALAASGGTTPYAWSVASGTLPAGLTLAPSTGVISGTPTTAGSSTFTVKVTDGGSPAQTKSVSTSITVAAPTLAITSSSLGGATSNTAYSQTLTASGGTTPYAWSVASGTLPAGLTLAPSTGVISGTPTTTGSSTFTVKVTDGGSPAQTKSVSTSITVAATTLAITSSSLAAGTSSTTYSQSLSASGGVTPYTWAISSGTLPAGLTLAPSTGVISGTPTTSGSSTFTVKVTDGGSPAQTKSVSTSIAVTASPLSISSSNLASGTNGTAYAQSLSATGGTAAYTWNYSGTLPAGLTLAATTGVISGTPTTTGTFSFTVRVTDNSTPSQSQSATTAITVAAATTVPSGPGTTWYVRNDGGTRYSSNTTNGQCDGKADAAYSGVGTNQHCAFNDYRFLYDDQSYGNKAWVIAGGDTVILRGGPWRIGFNQGTSSNDKWCVGGSGPYDCSNPVVPAGTATQHTRILGENYGSCNATNKTQIFGGFGVTFALNLNDAQYVDVSCIEITRHSDCIRHGVPAYPAGCSTSIPLDDYDGDGITTSNTTHDLTLTDMWIHGHTDRGIIGPIGANVTCLRCDISYNGMGGWDFDDGRATVFGANASWNFLYSRISWNGCNQEYPITHTFPAISCYGQSSGGYGDGVGTPAGTGTGMTVVVDHSTFDHNTQDGIDLGHMDAGTNALTFTNNTLYANSGGTVKWGAYFQSATLNNNLIEANCLRMSAPIAGAPSTYNTSLGDFCRAQDGVSFNLLQNATATFANNTIVSYAPTTVDINCWDPSCTNSTFKFTNNIMVGYNNPTTWNMGGQSGGPGAFYYQAPIGNVIRNNNLYYGVRNISCPTGNTGEICASPLFVNQPTWVDESSLDNFNFNLTPGSPAKGAGVTLQYLPLDSNGATRGNPPSLGAIE